MAWTGRTESSRSKICIALAKILYSDDGSTFSLYTSEYETKTAYEKFLSSLIAAMIDEDQHAGKRPIISSPSSVMASVPPCIPSNKSNTSSSSSDMTTSARPVHFSYNHINVVPGRVPSLTFAVLSKPVIELNTASTARGSTPLSSGTCLFAPEMVYDFPLLLTP